MIEILSSATPVASTGFGMTGLLAGGGIIALIMAFWNNIKSYILRALSFCIATSYVASGYYRQSRKILIKNIIQKYRVGFFSSKRYEYGDIYDESNQRIERSIVYKIPRYGDATLWRKIFPLFVKLEDDGVTFTYLRGTFNLEKFLIESIAECNEFVKASSNDEYFGTGYSVTKIILHDQGDRGTALEARNEDNKSKEPPTADNHNIIDHVKYKIADPLGWDADELLSKKFKPTGSKGLILSNGASVLQKDIEQYLRSKKWFFDKGASWTKGYILYGEPGTGKTSLVRHIAKKYRLPIYVFDLSTLNNMSLSAMWDQYGKSSEPKIFLLEDIDAVFHGRKNITDTGLINAKLTFDCLLNTIDGVDDKVNRILFVTTNKIELVDPALGGTFETDKILSKNPDILELASRPGRIDRTLYCGNLNYDGYLSIAKYVMEGHATPEEAEQFTKEHHENKTPAQFKELCINFTIHRIYNSRNSD